MTNRRWVIRQTPAHIGTSQLRTPCSALDNKPQCKHHFSWDKLSHNRQQPCLRVPPTVISNRFGFVTERQPQVSLTASSTQVHLSLHAGFPQTIISNLSNVFLVYFVKLQLKNMSPIQSRTATHYPIMNSKPLIQS